MNQQKVNRIVEYVRTQHEFPFDASDVEENVQDVLAYFSVVTLLDDEELAEIRDEFLRFGLDAEVAEIARLVEQDLAWPSA